VDDGGFDVWYRAEHRRVAAVLVALSADPDVAEDATDEAFARALDRWSEVAGMDRPEAWVVTVALNCLRRTLRRRTLERALWRRRPPERGADQLALPRPELWAAVRALPERQRLAVVLRYVADLPEADVAAVMGVSRGTVAASLSAARGRLADALGEATPRACQLDCVRAQVVIG